MRFALTEEQLAFADMLDDMLTAAKTTQIVRDWANGEHGPGLELWQRLADVGVTGLGVPESQGGLGAGPVDLVVACEALGRHIVPGPWVESVALLPALFAGTSGRDTTADGDLLAGIASGRLVATACAPPRAPFALDADIATHTFVIGPEMITSGKPGDRHRSLDPGRRLFEAVVETDGRPLDPARVRLALDVAALAVAAQLLGVGERLLEQTVDYAKLRRQFGRAIGEYQAVKHALANVRVALDFARPLVWVAALSSANATGTAARDIAAAKVAVSDAAYGAARTALQVHGAIGYTAEYDLGLWITKARALTTAWGTPTEHRATVLDALVREVSVATDPRAANSG
jgi:alkylation response protein AidB-like acyl-CoA dehydrogenase